MGAVLKFSERTTDAMADEREATGDGGNAAPQTRSGDPDGTIIQTVRRVDGTLSIAQRWGTMLGAFIIMIFGLGVQYAQLQSFRDDFRSLKEDVHELRVARDADQSKITAAEARIKMLESYQDDTTKIDHIYVDGLRVEKKARELVEQQKKKEN